MQRIGPFRDPTTFPKLEPPREGPPTRGRSTAREGTTEIVVQWDGLHPSDLRRWDENENPYENLASDPKVAERALRLVKATIQQYEQDTLGLQRKWHELNYLLQGRSLRWGAWSDSDAVHSPILYQVLENLEARITDAILNTSAGDGEWFVPRGREESDINVEAAIQGWCAWCLDKNKFDQRISEIVRTMLIYAFAPVTTKWKNTLDWRVRRNRERLPSPRGPLIKTKRTEEFRLIDSGPEIELIDPRWFFGDVRYNDPQKMHWVGHCTRMSYDEILACHDKGEFENALLLAGQEPEAQNARYSWVDPDSSGTSSTAPTAFRSHALGGSKVFFVDIWYGRFDPYNTGRTREFEMVIANGRVPLLIVENRHDDKHRPIALARACKYPFSLHSVGPLDHCLPLSIEIDTHRQLALEGSRLSVCPLVFSDQKEDIGESLYGVEPGKVFDVNPNAVKFSDIKSPVANMIDMEAVLTSDIEKTAGAPGFYTGADAQGTNSATEYEGRRREANMRIRSYIRSMAELCSEVLHQVTSLSGQYLRSERLVRVIGSKASWLGDRLKVAPEMFDAPIDFEFVVLGNMHVTGMEATGAQLFLNSVLPFAPPGQINQARLTERMGRMLLGNRAAGIIADVEDTRQLMSQDDELMLMIDGQQATVREGDDDRDHLDWLEGFKMSPMWEAIDDSARNRIEEHEAAHREQIGRKRRQQMALMSYQPPFPIAGAASPLGQGSATNMLRANERQMTGGGGPSGTPVGETPGPGRMDQMPNAGKMMPFSQGSNEGFRAAG